MEYLVGGQRSTRVVKEMCTSKYTHASEYTSAEKLLELPLRTSGACHLTAPPFRDDDEVPKVTALITKDIPKSAITALSSSVMRILS